MCLALQLLVIKRTGEWQGPSPPLPLPFTHPSRLNVSTSPVWFEILVYLNSLSCDSNILNHVLRTEQAGGGGGSGLPSVSFPLHNVEVIFPL